MVTGVTEKVETIHSPKRQKAMLWEDRLVIQVKGGYGLDLKDLSNNIIAKYEMSFFD